MSYEEYESQEAPISLQMASVAVCLHALAWAINATIIAVNFEQTGSLWRVLISFAVTFLTGIELLSGKKWAWYISLVMGVIYLGRALVGFAGLTFLRTSGYIAAGEVNILLLLIDILLLVAALFYLLHRSTRRACEIG